MSQAINCSIEWMYCFIIQDLNYFFHFYKPGWILATLYFYIGQINQWIIVLPLVHLLALLQASAAVSLTTLYLTFLFASSWAMSFGTPIEMLKITFDRSREAHKLSCLKTVVGDQPITLASNFFFLLRIIG